MKAPDKKKLKKDEAKAVVGAVVVDDVDDEVAETKPEPSKSFTASGVEIVDEISDGSVSSETGQRQKAAAAIAQISEDENIEIVFLEELYDYPVIGNFNFRDKFGISKIRKHQKFSVPRNVAMVLLDRRLVTIPSMAVA